MKTNRILIINPFGIGDVLFTTPFIRALRRQFRNSFIGFICNSRTAPILRANKNIDEVFVFDKGDYRAIWRRSKIQCIKQFLALLALVKSKGFDIAIDLSLGHQYGFFLMLLGVGVRMGYDFKGRGRFLTHKIDIDGYYDKHIAEYYLDLLEFLQASLQGNSDIKCQGLLSNFLHVILREPRRGDRRISLFPIFGRIPLLRGKKRFFGFASQNLRMTYEKVASLSSVAGNYSRNLEIFIPQEDLSWVDDFLKENGAALSDKLLAVVPGGGASWGKAAIYKHWPAENFAKAADGLIDKYAFKAIVFGSNDDMDICGDVLKSMRNKAVSACGKAGLLQFAALLKKCSLVLCNDGGPLHMAVAAGVKTVSVFGPVNEKVYGPYPASNEHIVLKKDLNCRPCYNRFKLQGCPERICLLDIRPEDAIKAAEKLLNC